MEKFFRVFSLIFVLNTACAQTQTENEKIFAMLKEFYISHNIAWARSAGSENLIKELDSLQHLYCTDSLKTVLDKVFQDQGLDHDIFTNDFGTDLESLKTMVISKDPNKRNCFIVSYIANTFDPSGKPKKEEVTILLSVKKENGKYKINDVW